MTKLQNDTFLRALMRQPVPYTPVWIMRQAGRYLPEYRKVREQAGDFLTLCKTPELACQVTLQPLERFNLDAAILFSDILTIPDAMGLGLTFAEGEGPRFAKPIRNQQDVNKLSVPDPAAELNYVNEAIRLINQSLAGKVPLIGFAGSPWTLACYMVEGGSSRDFKHIKAMLYQEPKLLHHLLGILAESVIQYLNAQIRAGVHAVMLFDTWGGILTTSAYQQFSLAYMTHVISGLQRYQNDTTIPVILFTKGGGQWLPSMVDSGCDALGIDWTFELSRARSMVADKVALQGNLDPAALYAKPEQIRQEVGRTLASYGYGSGHVFNLGHGITPDISPDHVKIMVDAVHELSREYHS